MYRGKQGRMVLDNMKPERSGFATIPDGVCEISLRTCKCVSSPSQTKGRSVHDKRNSRDAKYDQKLALGKRMNTSRRVIRDKSVAEVTISTPGVRSQARCTSRKVPEESARRARVHRLSN